MGEVQWTAYPHVAACAPARAWLQMQAQLCLAPKTIAAYGDSLNDYLSFCARCDLTPTTVTREQIATYVQDLTTRPRARPSRVRTLDAPAGLANATIQLRLTVVRLYHDHLVETQVRSDNPVGRGRYTPGNAFGGKRDRALFARHQKLPWIPSDDQWHTILTSLREESPRNRLMLLLAYDGALRRGELLGLRVDDLDVAFRHVRVRAESAKNGAARTVFYSEATSRALAVYLPQRRALSAAPGPLFLSQSRRNRAQPLSPLMWSKIVAGLAARAGLPQFTTHTPRHLRLTHMARAGLDLHKIALYAGHRSLQTTMLYIHLSGVELVEAVTRGMAGIDRWLAAALQEME
jgi:site-specific recombinase XerD